MLWKDKTVVLRRVVHGGSGNDKVCGVPECLLLCSSEAQPCSGAAVWL